MSHWRHSTLVNRIAIPVDAPDRIRVVPWGRVESSSGNFEIDARVARDILSAFEANGVDLPIDFEHTTVGGKFSSPDGSAPAMGWIKSLEAVSGAGIYAKVEWTPRGAEYIANKEYRYLSPTLMHPPGSNRPSALHSVALTNTPAIRNMQPIVNSDINVTDKEVPMDTIREALGLPDGADEAACTKAIETLKAKVASHTKTAGQLRVAACKAAGLDPESVEKDEEIVTALGALKAAPASKTGDVVPRAEFDAVTTSLKQTTAELSALSAQVTDRDAEDRITAALSAGKLTQDMLKPNAEGKNHFRELARDGTAWTAFIARQPVIVPQDGVVAANKASGQAAGGRQAIIAEAKSEYAAEAVKVCSQSEWINESLREHDLAPLSEDEIKTHAA